MAVNNWKKMDMKDYSVLIRLMETGVVSELLAVSL